MRLEKLTRFENSKYRFRLTKIASKRVGQVCAGDRDVGAFILLRVDASEDNSALTFVKVYNPETYLRTSPVIKITKSTKNTTTFETEGGTYVLEKLVEDGL